MADSYEIDHKVMDGDLPDDSETTLLMPDVGSGFLHPFCQQQNQGATKYYKKAEKVESANIHYVNAGKVK